jgi:putative NAD(P)H nitroreductase
MTVSEALQTRRAIPSFDPTFSILKEELENLIQLACLAPSSMNLQPWEFLVCYSAEDKARMQSVTMNQKKVSEASAVLAVICNLDFPDHGEAVADSNIAKGCSLWAMAFMLAAAESGWDTAPMGGFVAESLISEFGLPETRFPVLVIAIGKRNSNVTILDRSIRFPTEDLVHVGNW